MANFLLNNIINEIAIHTTNNLPIKTSEEIANKIASIFIENQINDIAKQHCQQFNWEFY